MQSRVRMEGPAGSLLDPEKVLPEVTADDETLFLEITSTSLTSEQEDRMTTPARVYPHQVEVLGVHWHPEFVPMDWIRRRITATFPNMEDSLIIPTQHNALTSYGSYSGVEIDCYSSGFNQKVQLLLHFESRSIEDASVLKSILTHTFKYRLTQLDEFLHALTTPRGEGMETAARRTGADEKLVRFVQAISGRIKTLLEAHRGSVPPEMVKNKLVRNFFDGLRGAYPDLWIDRVQNLVTEVKQTVKASFSLRYFYRTSEVIEEARHLNAGIVIPHPEQFWPILLADYDVDGIEVWNPQSNTYTEFLISVLNRKNRRSGLSRRSLLVFMGDDTHMSEKVRDPEVQDREKASREVGVQPGWEDLNIRKALVMADMNRAQVIQAYRERLAG
jgi:hypothetical protein